MNINLVLTAHPTEITRRTMTQKFHRIANLLLREPVLQHPFFWQLLRERRLFERHLGDYPFSEHQTCCACRPLSHAALRR